MDRGLRGEPRPSARDYTRYINSHAWRLRRAAAIADAGGRCQVCNSPEALEAHHRTYVRFGEELPGDLTVLCATCHAMYHLGPHARKLRSEAVDPWDELVTWALSELRATLGGIEVMLAIEHDATGRMGALRHEADFALKEVDRQFAKYHQKQQAKRQA